MQVGDLVRHFLTEQVGIVLTVVVVKPRRSIASIQVLWTTQGDSLFGPGRKKRWAAVDDVWVLWTDKPKPKIEAGRFLEVLNASR